MTRPCEGRDGRGRTGDGGDEGGVDSGAEENEKVEQERLRRRHKEEGLRRTMKSLLREFERESLRRRHKEVGLRARARARACACAQQASRAVSPWIATFASRLCLCLCVCEREREREREREFVGVYMRVVYAGARVVRWCVGACVRGWVGVCGA